jgi:hypothetical protein
MAEDFAITRSEFPSRNGRGTSHFLIPSFTALHSGEGPELFHSGNAMEDSLPLFAFQSLQFTNGGRIIFASEKDGHNHLYSIAAESGTPQLLTPGNFDVEDVALSADERSVLYSSNQDDVDRRRRKTINGRHAAPNSNRLCTTFLFSGRPFPLDHRNRYC